MSEEALMSGADAYAIADKVLEMADRVKVIDKVQPGAVAKWGVEIDGVWFDLALTVRRKASA